MKSRIVALALAAVMTLGSCMSASAKEVFTKGLIGGAVVKNSSYVESVDVIDVNIWEQANKASLWQLVADANKVKQVSATSSNANDLAQDKIGATITLGGVTYNTNNAYQVAFRNLTTDQQAVLLTLIQNYGYTVARDTADDTAVTAPYKTGWSYTTWVSAMQIAPYAERYIVAMNYKTLYEQLENLAKAAVAQGQITVSDAYANSADYTTAKTALNILDAKVTKVGDGTFSGATIKVGAFPEKKVASGADTITPDGSSVAYRIYPVIYGIPQTDYLTALKPVAAGMQYVAVPQETTTSATFSVRDLDTTTGKLTLRTFTQGTKATWTAVDGTTLTPIQILTSYINFTAESYKKEVDNALQVASDLAASFKKSKDYYNGQIDEGLVYLITNVRPDLKITKDNIDAKIGFDLDPYDKLKWNIGETKRIAFTSPSISSFTTGNSLVVLHFNTTSCTWESIPAEFVEYNGVKGIEGTFSSASPVIVVTLKNYNDAGAGAAAKATDAKKSPATGENF